MTPLTGITSISFAALPALGADLEGGIFAGITTHKDGTHHAVIRLPENGTNLTHKKASAWAKKQGAELPTRPIASLLFANVKDTLPSGWGWTSEEYSASFAWNCHFSHGIIDFDLKSYEGSAFAVRLIPLTA